MAGNAGAGKRSPAVMTGGSNGGRRLLLDYGEMSKHAGEGRTRHPRLRARSGRLLSIKLKTV
jgi:hypothetical protein